MSLELKVVLEYPRYVADEQATVDLAVSLTAHANPHNKRAPLFVSAILDKSGSMAGRKIDLVKSTTQFMTRQLVSNDRMGIVAYDSTVDELLSLTLMDEQGKKIADMKLASNLKPGSTTNMSGGLFKGLQQQKEQSNDGGEAGPVRSVILFTDGLANVGITDKTTLVEALKKQLDSDNPIQVHTLGYGKDHDASLLQEVSDVGGGNYYYIEKAENIPHAFADVLGGLVSVVAQNVEVRVRKGNADAHVEKVFSGFDVKDCEDGSKKINFGDLYSEEGKDIIIRVVLPKLVDPQESQDVLVVSLSYLDVIDLEMKTVEMTVKVERPSVLPDPSPVPNQLVVDQRCRFDVIETIKKASSEADAGRLTNALEMIKACHSRIQKAVNAGTLGEDLLRDLRECERNVQSKAYYSQEGSKKMRQCSQMHSRQRTGNRYTTSTQKTMMMSAARESVSRPQQSEPITRPNPVNQPNANPSETQNPDAQAGNRTADPQNAEGGAGNRRHRRSSSFRDMLTQFRNSMRGRLSNNERNEVGPSMDSVNGHQGSYRKT